MLKELLHHPSFSNIEISSGFIIVSVLGLIVQPAYGWFPVWLKEDSYAKYEIVEDSFRWQCIGIVGNMAQLNVTFTSRDGTIRRSALLYVDSETRNVTLANGLYVGKTLLWLPANPRQDETIVLNDNMIAKVQVSAGSWQTSQGNQRTFTVENWTFSFRNEYDLDTGILICGNSWNWEATLRALNVTQFFIGPTNLIETNIDLGPREWWPEIGGILPLILPVAAFVSISIVLLNRQIKKRRRKTPKVRKSTISKRKMRPSGEYSYGRTKAVTWFKDWLTGARWKQETNWATLGSYP